MVLLVRGRIFPEHRHPVSRFLIALYKPFVYVALRKPKTTLAIGGQQVQTWLVEARLHLLGPKSQGEVDVKTWFAPRYSQTVQEVWDDNLISGGVAYKAQWMSTLANLQPSR